MLNWVVCQTNGVCIVILISFLTNYNDEFAILETIVWVPVGILLGILFFTLVTKVSQRVFCVLLGNLVGFCLTNVFEMMYFFTIPNSQYIEYYVSVAFFVILTNLVPFGIFDYELSFCGAFFLTKGIIILYKNDQIAEIKMFLAQTNFFT